MQGSLGSVTVRSGARAGVACGVGYQEHGTTSAGAFISGPGCCCWEGGGFRGGLVWVGYDVSPCTYRISFCCVSRVLRKGRVWRIIVKSGVINTKYGRAKPDKVLQLKEYFCSIMDIVSDLLFEKLVVSKSDT